MSLKSTEKLATNSYKVEIEVDGATFQAAIQKVFNKQKKNIQVPGFRKGKATLGMVERYYGEGVFWNDAFEELYPDAVEAAIKEAELEIVDYPTDIDVSEINKDGLTFSVVCTTKPEVSVKDYKGIAVTKPSTEVTDEDVDKEIQTLLDRQARFVEVDRAAEDGDMVTLDFEGFTDGKPFDGGKAEGYELQLGSGQFIPGFEEQIVGKKVDEDFDVNVTFPEEYAPELAGKDATFKCVLHAVKVKELPELDDEFAMDVSEYDTLDELKKHTKEDLTKKKEEDADNAVSNGVYEALAELVEGDIPECMYERQIDDSINEFSYSMQAQGIDLKTYLSFTGGSEEQLRETFRDQAEKQVKCRLALEKIADLEKVEVSDEDIDAKYAEMSADYGMEVDQIKQFISAEDVAADLKTTKALQIVKDAAKLEEAKPEKKSAAKKAAPKKSEKKADKAESADADLSGMTKAQLQEYAAEKGIEVKASMTKAAMIEAIEAAK